MEEIQAFVSANGGGTDACRVATAHNVVGKDECAYTFHSPYTSARGILVHLKTFTGTVQELSMLHAPPKERALFVRIVKQRIAKPPKEGAGDEASKAAPTKLGIGVEGGFAAEEDAYETVSTHSVVLMQSPDKGQNAPTVIAEVPYTTETQSTFPAAVKESVESILVHVGSAIQQDVKVWQLDAAEDIPVSKYAADLPFVDNGVMISPNPADWKCQASGATENVWLNLSDGYMGGGRRNWDGSGGSNGALDHFEETGRKYPLVVKLGTITADLDTADCYSYAPDEDGPVKVPNLAELLQKRGIHVAGLQKTVKSTAELEVELNANYAFDAITEAGSELVPVSGPSCQGLQNLGNSCYMNSVLQLLFSGMVVPELAHRYGTVPQGSILQHSFLQTAPPTAAATDLLVQTTKVACALTSGVFAKPIEEEDKKEPTKGTALPSSTSTDPKYRLAPRMFKHVIGKNHVDFCTGQQQDAAQFLLYLLEQLDRTEKGLATRALQEDDDSSTALRKALHLVEKTDGDNGDKASYTLYPTSHLFGFATETRLQCQADGKVKYKTASAPESILSLRIPMDKAQVKDDGEADKTDKMETENAEVTSPEQKRLKAEDKKPVPSISLQTCLEEWAAETTVEGIRWSHLPERTPAQQRLRLSNFPRYLIVQMQRYQLGPDWTPVKLEVCVEIPQDELDLNFLKATGPQGGEVLAPDDDDDNNTNDNKGANPSASSAKPVIDEVALSQLMDMGFSLNSCKRALTAVGGSNVEAAMGWVFEHNTDPDFNDPLPDDNDTIMTEATSSAGGSTSAVDEGVVESLVANLGCFTSDQVRAALVETSGSADRAADWLFSHMDDLDSAVAALQAKQAGSSDAAATTTSTSGSNRVDASPPLENGPGKYKLMGMVSHIGKHTGSGHYVAHLRRASDDSWIILNDEKVALSAEPPIPHAYFYLFQRIDTMGKPLY